MYLLGSYNNFIIFRVSFSHLINGQNLYLEYPKEYGDVFLYSPTFAVLMAPFSVMPYWLCLLLWTGAACTAMYFAIRMFPHMDPLKKSVVFLVLVIELVTSLQNTQTSPLIAAMIALIFICFEKKQVFWASFFIVLITFIKIYGLATAMLFILYPGKGKFILSMVFWGLIFFFLPVIVIPLKQLFWQYHNWYYQITEVHKGEETGIHANLLKPPLSVMEWLKLWFHFSPAAYYIQLAGLGILTAPLLRIKAYAIVVFRYFLLSSILIFCMIFNHIAESPSYVIAVFGVAIWFAWEQKNAVTWFLMGLAFIFTILSATDIFPEYIRHNYVIPYVWKAVPCIFIWCWIQYRLWTIIR
jgi:hypothetical protein